VLVNGRPLTKAGRRRIGYVLQVRRRAAATRWPGAAGVCRLVPAGPLMGLLSSSCSAPNLPRPPEAPPAMTRPAPRPAPRTQDDVLYEALTVRETLGYAARLRLPAHMSREEKLARAEDVIKALGCACRAAPPGAVQWYTTDRHLN
jgi:hypothetical protein